MTIVNTGVCIHRSRSDSITLKIISQRWQ
uniref:Uncharacterized protein n=1 Tax=Rhizophora mucronata TaxID=61149 RepID=A0A2P2PCQ9_RHIMU